MLHCCDALLLNHHCWKQIVDICETQYGPVSEDFGNYGVTGGVNSVS